MRNLLLPFACLTMLTTMIVSCKKSSNTPPVDEIAQLTRNWVLTSATISPAIGGITDFFNDWWDACERDDIYKFQAGGVYIDDEGPISCSGGTQTRTGIWTYDKNKKELFFKASYDYYTMNVIELNNTHFKATTKDIVGGIIYTETWTFKAH